MPLFNNFPYTNFHEMNLDWLIEKVKSFEPVQNTVNELAGKYNAMYNKVDQLSAQFDSFASDMRSLFNQYAEATTEEFTRQLDNMWFLVVAFQEQTAQRVSDVETRMDNVERTVVNSAYMDSPFTGEYVPVQQVIYQLASLHTTGALTAAEYDAAELSASAYDALQLTAYEYDWNGSSYIS